MAKISEAFVGSVHAQLTVLSMFRRLLRGKQLAFASCQCSCGTLTVVQVGKLGHHTHSCGCFQRRAASAKNTIHGLSKTRTYSSWQNMWKRCTNPKDTSHEIYKTRVPSEAWRDYKVFLADMGECPTGLSIERLENNKHYSKENCVWASRKVQSRNKSSNIIVVLDGKPMCLTNAAELEGLNYSTVHKRLSRSSWSLARALENPKYSWPGEANPCIANFLE